LAKNAGYSSVTVNERMDTR